MPVRFLFFLLTILLPACQDSPRQITPAFYHWQTKLALTAKERAYLDSLRVKNLYVKFFDVDLDQDRRPVPLAQVQVDTAYLAGLEIIPTLFITNQTIQQLTTEQVDDFAERIIKKIEALAEQLPKTPIREIQLDCDWTASTKATYFQLLRNVNRYVSKKNMALTVTIRLHQLRDYAQTGIPPVDRGTLMFYNMGDVRDWEEEHAILSLDNARPYLSSFDQYPLKLDLALPIFAWGILFREGRMIRLINDLRPEDLNDNAHFIKIGKNRFEVVKSTYLNSYYLYQGDLIRIEEVNVKALKESADLLKSLFLEEDYTLIFYHLDTSTIQHIPAEDLGAVIQKMEQLE